MRQKEFEFVIVHLFNYCFKVLVIFLLFFALFYINFVVTIFTVIFLTGLFTMFYFLTRPKNNETYGRKNFSTG